MNEFIEIKGVLRDFCPRPKRNFSCDIWGVSEITALLRSCLLLLLLLLFWVDVHSQELFEHFVYKIIHLRDFQRFTRLCLKRPVYPTQSNFYLSSVFIYNDLPEHSIVFIVIA